MPRRRLDVRNDPHTLAARLSDFAGVFTVEAVEGGTRISHRESVRFPRAIAWFMERLLGAWLAKDTPAEVQRMKVLLEGRVMRSPPTG